MLDLEDLIDEFYIFKLLLLRICNNESSQYPLSAKEPRLIDCNCGRSIEMNEYRNENWILSIIVVSDSWNAESPNVIVCRLGRSIEMNEYRNEYKYLEL